MWVFLLSALWVVLMLQKQQSSYNHEEENHMTKDRSDSWKRWKWEDCDSWWKPWVTAFWLFEADCISNRVRLNSNESTCQHRRCRSDFWVWKIPYRRKWQPTPVFLPGESHGQRSYNPWPMDHLSSCVTSGNLKSWLCLKSLSAPSLARVACLLSTNLRNLLEK